MAYVLVPPLPPGARKSDYVPLERQLHTRERRGPVEGNVRAGDNSGSASLAAALQGAFENNASDAGRTDTQKARRSLRRGDKQKAVEPVKPVEPVEVIDDEDEDEEEGEARNQERGTLAHALSAAFAHNSANPNVVASSMAGTNGSTRQSRRNTREEVVSNSASVEIVAAPPAKHSRAQPRPRITTNADNDRNKSIPMPTSRRRNEKRQPLTPPSPQKKRRRLARRGDASDAHDSEDGGEVEIVGRTQQQTGNSRSKAGPPRLKPGHTSQQRNASINLISVPASERSLSPTPPPQSPSATPPPRDELPLTILPVPSPADIVISTRALFHLHSPPGPPDRLYEPRAEGEEVGGAPRRYGFLQGFHGEEAAAGAHGLLVSPAAATTAVDSSVRATTINTTADDLHHPTMDLGLDIVVPMDIGDGEQEQVQERQDQDAVRAAVVPPHALRVSSAAHPDGPMLGFALPEHEGVGRSSPSADPDTDASSDGFGLGFDVDTGQNMLFMMAPLNPCFSDGTTGSIDWGAAAGPSTGVVPGGDYIGDGTIDPSMLGGPGAGSPYKIFKSDAAAASVAGRGVVRASDADKILDEEDDVEGLLFQDPVDGEFVPPPSKGKDKIRVVGKADTTVRRINAGEARIRTKSWRKALAEENKESDANTDTEVNESVADETAMLSMKTYCHHCRCKTTRPKMRCTRIRASMSTQCCKLYCNLCIEKRYVWLRLSPNPMHNGRLN
jgi:hypothetical protein